MFPSAQDPRPTHWGLGVCQCSLKDRSNNNFCLTLGVSGLYLMLFVVCAGLGGGNTQEREDALQAHPGESPNISLSLPGPCPSPK